MFYVIQGLYRNASRELKRLDNISRSPVIATFGETLSGLVTIRACGVESELRDEFYNVVDVNSKVSLISSLCGK
jgi:hypothetical protein